MTDIETPQRTSDTDDARRRERAMRRDHAADAARASDTRAAGTGDGDAPGRPGDAREETPVVEIRGATASIAGRTLWSELDLSVRPGEFVAVLGPNGAGKTTLIRMIMGTHEPSAGTVKVLGEAPGHARSAVGYLPQRRHVEGGARIRGVDLVRLGWDGHRWGLPLGWLLRTRAEHAARRRVAEVIDMVGASAHARRPIGELSGGEQQRLLIAQALVRRPRLLLLDEPLDSLDLPNQQAVAALIGRVCRTQHVSVLMVAHDVNPILPYLDRVLYVAPGGSAAGPVDEVITSETLTRLYRSPIEVLRTSSGRPVVVGAPDTAARHLDAHHEPRRDGVDEAADA
jgi:zinc/manganese transport system ATP-binding protein